MLNDEKEYTILKCGTKYKFFKGVKKYYPDWNKNEDLLYEGVINFDIYKLALEVFKLRSKIVTKTNQLLDDEEDNTLFIYQEKKTELKKKLEKFV